MFDFRLSLKNIWGNGVLYDEDKTMLLIEGGNQTWYSFKSSIIDHISCNPKRGGGNFHFKSKQFEAAQEKQFMSTLSATTKVVGCALQVCAVHVPNNQFSKKLQAFSEGFAKRDYFSYKQNYIFLLSPDWRSFRK